MSAHLLLEKMAGGKTYQYFTIETQSLASLLGDRQGVGIRASTGKVDHLGRLSASQPSLDCLPRLYLDKLGGDESRLGRSSKVEKGVILRLEVVL